jgi:hypothetical protein
VQFFFGRFRQLADQALHCNLFAGTGKKDFRFNP